MKTNIPPSVNWHLWAGCNMKCRFCFATFGDVTSRLGGRPSLPRTDNIALAALLGKAFSKVSVAGGEPTLCPYLDQVLTTLKAQGATTSIITNGSVLIRRPDVLERISRHLDWVGISVDSFEKRTALKLGRAVGGGPATYEANDYIRLAARVHKLGIRLKVNTVVNRANVDEDLADTIRAMEPERVKFLRVLPVQGQNDGAVDDLLITDLEFRRFVARHRATLGAVLVAEDHDDVIGGYAMVSPDGRFFDNVDGRLSYSGPILDEGLIAAWASVRFDRDAFERRGGTYDWKRRAS